MAVLATLSDRRTSTSSPSSITLSFSGLTGTKCCLTVKGISAAFNSGSISATWKGDPVPAIASAQNGEQNSEISVLALGNLSNESGDVVLSKTEGASTALACEATIHTGIDQANPVRAFQSSNPGSSGSSLSVTLTGLTPGDVCESAMCIAPSANNFGASQPEVVVWNPLGGSGLEDSLGGTSRITATGTSQNMAWSWSFNRGRVLAAVALAPDTTAVDITSVTGSRGPNLSIPPSDTNVDVQHSGADEPGITKMFLADGDDFLTATLVEQSISAITPIDLNWDAVTLGPLQTGLLWLFIQIDVGGPEEAESEAFPVFVSDQEVLIAGRTYKCLGTEVGITEVIGDVPFTPNGALIRVNSTTVRGAFNAEYIGTTCMMSWVDGPMGECSASQDSPVVTKRQQAVGTDSLIVLDPSTTGSVEYVLGTPIPADAGMDVNFTRTAPGYELVVIFFGGATTQCAVRKVTISDGAVTDLPFQPDMVFASSTGQNATSPGDDTFSNNCMGWYDGTNSIMVSAVLTTDRNSGMRSDILLSQVSGTSNIWEMTPTGFTANGMTWSGSNLDSAYLMFFKLDGAQTFLNMWQKNLSTTPGEIESLPDTGIDNLGWLWQMNAHTTTEGLSPAVGARWGSGVVGADGQHSELSYHNPATGTGLAESRLTFGVFVEGTDLATSTLTLQGTITKLQRIPEIRWDLNQASILFGLVGWEIIGDVGVGERDAGVHFGGRLGAG